MLEAVDGPQLERTKFDGLFDSLPNLSALDLDCPVLGYEMGERAFYLADKGISMSGLFPLLQESGESLGRSWLRSVFLDAGCGESGSI